MTPAARLEGFLVRLPVGDLDRLRRLAADADRTVSAEIRRAVRHYLEQETT